MPSGTHLKIQLGRAIWISLVASFFYASMLAFTKYSTASFSTIELVFYRSLISLMIVCIWVFARHTSQSLGHLKTKELKVQLTRSITGLAAIFLFFFALRTISLSEGTVLVNTIPIFVPITAFLWKGIKINHRLWPGILIAFLGIIIILRPQTNHLEIGLLLGLLGGVMGSISTIALRTSHYTEPVSRTLFYYFLFSSAISLVLLLFQRPGFHYLLDPKLLFLLLSIGVTGFVYQLFLSLSLKYAPARLVTPFFYASVVFGIFFDHILWGEAVHLWQMLGIVLVFIGVCLLVLLYPKENVGAK